MRAECQTGASVTERIYALDIKPAARMEYDLSRSPLFRLYEKSKDRQWDARTVVDWSEPLEEANPLGLPDSTFPLGRSPWFAALSRARKDEVRRHYQCWLVSQFLHGEQFGVLSASRIALEAREHDSKFFSAMQAVDEARHLETYIRLTEKMGHRYPVSEPFGRFLDAVICAHDIDQVYLGLQVLGEGIGLASFAQIRRYTTSQPVQQIYARIMEDEARHVAFGRAFLRPLYEAMSPSELADREDFVVDACSLLEERFYALEVWEGFGLERPDARAALQQSPAFRVYRRELFKLIVPIVRDIGLWTPKVARFFESIGVSGYAASGAGSTLDAVLQGEGAHP